MKDRFEFKRFKRKPFFRVLYDTFITKLSFSILTVPFFVLVMHLMHVPYRKEHIAGLIVPIFFFIILTYYEQHKNATILIDNIRKLDMSRDKRILRIKYKENKRLRIKIVDMPNTDSASLYIIGQLNNRNLFIEDNSQLSDFLMKQSKHNHATNK
jgi:hypothetical protein